MGTPPRVVRVMPVTSWPETWVVYQDSACDVVQSTPGVSEECGPTRGDLFKSQRSETWESRGNFDLGLNTHLGYEGWGEYGEYFEPIGEDQN